MWRLWGGKAAAAGADGRPLDPAAVAQVRAFAEEVAGGTDDYQAKPDAFEAGRRILAERDPAARVELIRAVARAASRSEAPELDVLGPTRWRVSAVLRTLLNRLVRPVTPFTPEQLVAVLELARSRVSKYGYWDFPLGSLLGQVEAHASQRGGLPHALRAAVEALRAQLVPHASRGEVRRLLGQIDALLTGRTGPPPLSPGGPLGTIVLREVERLPEAERNRWTALLQHGLTVQATAPPKKWLSEARRLVEVIGEEAFAGRAARWLGLGPTPGAPRDTPATERDADLLKGLVWAASTVESPALARAVGDLGEACFRKIPNVGPVSVRAGNACIGALGRMPGADAAGQLGRLRMRVKYAAAQRLIAKALAEAARRAGVPAADLEEMAVPTYGLEGDGVLRESFGDAMAEVRVAGTAEVALTWTRAGGRTQKSVPAEVKAGHAEALRALQKTVKDIVRMLPAQRDRIERLYLAPRAWDLATWRARYLDHSLLATLCRRLVWSFRDGDRTGQGIWQDGRLVDAGDHPLDWLRSETQVSLWHPLGSDVATVLAWRRWLERHEVTQPFKQAHREVYVLTDAERQTATYSNRFAAHVLRQHQFAALCRERGWRYTLQGQWDSANTPALELPGGALRAEFWVEMPAGEAPTSQLAVYLQVTTDQVRFVTREGAAVRLAEVPPLVFSEVMRDVDLFVGVAGIGSDPTWQDQGQRPGYGEYWQRMAFGDLSASAQTRREILTTLLPKLKIADRCALEDRFLVVRGDLRTYKIHLGSGNILMEPGSRYLCIVPARGQAASPGGQVSPGRAPQVVLPFEGDTTFSIILSKAFLLAADTRITDPTIVRQIRTA